MPQKKTIATKNSGIIAKTPQRMLAWFADNRRPLLWRENRTPYRVWLAEVMLQQTTVATATGYFERFLTRFPDVHALAQAPLDDVLNLWQGLGYYNRARNLHKCAQEVSVEYSGHFPENADALQKLPGIGPYTSAAIACIAFDQPAPVVDGNIERVISRLFALKTPLPGSKPDIKKYVAKLTPEQHSGDYAEAMMDLGATICIPKSPRCSLCPLSDICKGHQQGIQATLPRKEKKKPRPEKSGDAFAFFAPDGSVFIRKRPEKGLLAGLWELPHTGWENRPLPDFAEKPAGKKITRIRHVFTHFGLELDLYKVTLKHKPNTNHGTWMHLNEMNDYAFSTLMKKAIGDIMSWTPSKAQL